MKDKPVQLWVHPKFKQLIKLEALKSNSDIVKFTEKIAEENHFIITKEKDNNGKPFRFRI